MAGAASCGGQAGKDINTCKVKASCIRKVVFVGVLNKIEIWSKDWDDNNDYDDE